MFDMKTINDYACYRYYRITYKRDYVDEVDVEGLLLNYNSGNVVLLSENGIWHIRCRDIVFMRPAKMVTEKFSKEFNDLVELFKR